MNSEVNESAGAKERLRRLLPTLESLDDNGNEPHGTSPSHLRLLAKEALGRTDLPTDKAGRWLGYVFGVLADRGAVTFDAGAIPGDDSNISGVVASACQQALVGLMPLLESLADSGMEHEGTKPSQLRLLAAAALEEQEMHPAGINWFLGFLQGVLTARGDMDMDAERDRTRPIFHNAYRKAGLEVPPTVIVKARA